MFESCEAPGAIVNGKDFARSAFGLRSHRLSDERDRCETPNRWIQYKGVKNDRLGFPGWPVMTGVAADRRIPRAVNRAQIET